MRIRPEMSVFVLYLAQQVAKHPIAEKYNLLVLFDERMMIKGDADHIYSAATQFAEPNRFCWCFGQRVG